MRILSAANRRENQNRASVVSCRPQSVKKADALAISKNVDVHPYIALLVNYSIEYSGRFSAQSGESVAHSGTRLIDFH